MLLNRDKKYNKKKRKETRRSKRSGEKRKRLPKIAMSV
jgi:hypothetical protein